jgi:hypothetical protein
MPLPNLRIDTACAVLWDRTGLQGAVALGSVPGSDFPFIKPTPLRSFNLSVFYSNLFPSWINFALLADGL